MRAADIVSELKNRLQSVDHSAYIRNKPPLDSRKQFSMVENFQELLEFLEEKKGKDLRLEGRGGMTFEFRNSEKIINLEETPKQEGLPGTTQQWGLYLTPPHGRLIWDGKKTAMIKSIKLKSHIGQPLYLLSGDTCYGIIKVSEPKEISISEFKNLEPKHSVSESERHRWWPTAEKLYYYLISFIRRWDHPKRWQKQQGAQIFVRDVKFQENFRLSSSTIIMLKEKANPEYKEDETRKEVIEAEQKKYGDWYRVKVKDPKKTYRYVAQYHRRGSSVHIDLRFEANNHLVGWTLNTPGVPEGSSKPQAEYMNTKEDKFLNPRSPSVGTDYQILCEQKLIQPKVWLTVKGKIPPGGIGATKHQEAEFIIISTGRVRFGCQKHDFHEYFLQPDSKWSQSKNLVGRWIISHIPRPQHYKRAGEGKFMWAMWKPEEQKPYTETHNLDTETKKAESEKGYMLWQNPYKGLIEDMDFREGKKKTWVY